MSNSPGRTVDDIYPSRWLRTEDLGGQARTVTIMDAQAEELRQGDGSKEWKIVLSFLGKRKQLACNVTQARRMQQLTGQQLFDKWVGARVRLFPDVASNGKDTIGIMAADAADTAEATKAETSGEE